MWIQYEPWNYIHSVEGLPCSLLTTLPGFMKHFMSLLFSSFTRINAIVAEIVDGCISAKMSRGASGETAKS